MARVRKTARQIAASRKNIKKAQLVSARKRRGTGKGRLIKRAAVGSALLAGTAVAAHYGRKAYIKKRMNYLRSTRVVYHRTGVYKAARIAKTRNWVSRTNARGVEGTSTGIWFSTKAPKRVSPLQYRPRKENPSISKYGSHVVSVRVPRNRLIPGEATLPGFYRRLGYTRGEATKGKLAGAAGYRQAGYVMIHANRLKGRPVKVRNLSIGNAHGKIQGLNAAKIHAGASSRMSYLPGNFRRSGTWNRSPVGRINRKRHRKAYAFSRKRLSHKEGIANTRQYYDELQRETGLARFKHPTGAGLFNF